MLDDLPDDATDSALSEEEAKQRELQMRDVRCHMLRGDEYWYPRNGDATKEFDADDCVRGQRWRPFLGKKRVNLFQVPDKSAFARQAAAPTLPDHIAVVEALAPSHPDMRAHEHAAPAVAARKPRHFTRNPGSVDDDPSRFALPSALADYELDLTQDLLYQYARGWVGERYDRRLDWTALTEPTNDAGERIMPDSTCGATDMRIKPYQMTVWVVLRAWMARQGSGGGSLLTAGAWNSVGAWDAATLGAGAVKVGRPLIRMGEPLTAAEAGRATPPFDPRRTPKGFLVYQSLGSGKTNVTVCGIQAFWNQRLLDGSPRPIYVITSKENKGQMAKKGDGSSRYYAAARSMFPSSLGALSSADFHGGFELLSFNQAGLRLGYPMSDLAEGEPPRRDIARARPEFVAQLRQAVILIDEPQGMFAPLPAFRNTNGGLREWLSSAEADDCTVVLLTATPGKSVAELFVLLNTLKRADEQLHPRDFVTPDGEADTAAFRQAVRGQVSFVDLSNNTNDFPSVSVEVVRAPMSPHHFSAWRERAVADAREEASGGPKAWANLFNKEEYAKTSRAWANMVYPGSKLPLPDAPFARDVYRRGQSEDIAQYSSKMAELVARVHARADVGKQYVYSAFGEQGIHQIADVLEAQGWTNVSGQLKALYEAVSALRKAGGVDAARILHKVQAAVDALPGEPFRRFITTREWKDDSAPSAGATGATGSNKADDEDTPRTSTAEQLMELDVFNAQRNAMGEVVNLLIASKKFNEGLDLKALRSMHIFEPLISVPAEQQTVGRGRRYCSHAALEPQDRNMIVYHYFSVEPRGQGELSLAITALEQAARHAELDAAEAEAEVAALQQRMQALTTKAQALQHAVTRVNGVKPRAHARTRAPEHDVLQDVDDAAVDEPTRTKRAATKRADTKRADTKRAATKRADTKRADTKEPPRKRASDTKRKPRAALAAGEMDVFEQLVAHEVIPTSADLVGGQDWARDSDGDSHSDSDSDLEGGRMLRKIASLPSAVVRGVVMGLKEWWQEPEPALTATVREASMKEADAHIAEVRQALLVQEQVMEAAERRLLDAKTAGREPSRMELVQSDLARDRIRVLKEHADALADSKRAVAQNAKFLERSTKSVSDDVVAQLVAVQEDMRVVTDKLDEAVQRVASAKNTASVARQEAAERRAFLLPEWNTSESGVTTAAGAAGLRVVGTGAGGRVLKKDIEAAERAAQPVMLTDVLIHGISRREYAPMKALLQAMRDAAIDCEVLHGLHARMGVETNCRV